MVADLTHALETLSLKLRITNGPALHQPAKSPSPNAPRLQTRVAYTFRSNNVDWRVDEFLDFRKSDDLVKLPIDLRLAHAQDRAVQKNIFPAR
jgi:hypothetical protein